MSELLQIKKAILDRLFPLFQLGCKVIDYPDPPKDSGRALGKAQITVAYVRSTFTPPTSYNVLTQDRLIEFGVYLLVQDLRNESLTLPIIEKTQELLTGFRPLDDGTMYPISDDFIDTGNGTFEREMRFVVPMKHYQKFTKR